VLKAISNDMQLMSSPLMTGSIPEYIVSYDVPEKALYLDLFTDATVSLAPLGAGAAASLRVATNWPYSPNVSLALALPTADPVSLTVMLRIPAWVAAPSVSVSFQAKAGGARVLVGTGTPGSYASTPSKSQLGVMPDQAT
jgi:hypothetical protein